jgi:hypothetical protein
LRKRGFTARIGKWLTRCPRIVGSSLRLKERIEALPSFCRLLD